MLKTQGNFKHIKNVSLVLYITTKIFNMPAELQVKTDVISWISFQSRTQVNLNDPDLL